MIKATAPRLELPKHFLNPFMTEPSTPLETSLSAVQRLDGHAKLSALTQLAQAFLEVGLERNPKLALEIALEAKDLAISLHDDASLANAQAIIGTSYVETLAFDEALEAFKLAFKQYEQLENQRGSAKMLLEQGQVFRTLEQHQDARERFAASLELSRFANAKDLEANSLNGLASIYDLEGNNVQALDFINRALEIHIELEDVRGQVTCLINLSILQLTLANYDKALEYELQAYKLLKDNQVKDSDLEARCLIGLGNVYEELGNDKTALEFFGEAAQLAKKHQLKDNQVLAMVNAGQVQNKLKHYDAAIEAFNQALGIARTIRMPSGALYAYQGLGKTFNSLGKYLESLEAYLQSLALAKNIVDRESEIIALLGLGVNQRSLGRFEVATNYFQEAQTLARTADQKKYVQDSIQELAQTFEMAGDPGKALAFYKEYHRLEKEIFNAEAEKKSRNLAVQFDLERSQTQAELYRVRSEAYKQNALSADQANRAKSEFLSRMSHELRTPLNAILGFAQLLGISSLSTNDRESVEQISKAGRHLLGLINEVLDIARIESGRIDMSLEAINPMDIVTESLDLIRPLAVQSGIQLLMNEDLSDNRLRITADRQRLKQILINLLSNAVKYNKKAGSVRVWLELAGTGQLRINVTDTGLGISSSKLEQLFTPFERLGAEQSRIEGSGIGLALSKRLIEAMSGLIGVSSRQGEGSTFYIELPIAPEVLSINSAQNLSELKPEEQPIKPILVVYIEDNPANIRLVQLILANRPNATLLTATDGLSGLELVREKQPNVVLLDLHLPDIEGHEVLNRLQADLSTKNIPVVILSADANPEQTTKLLEAGAKQYLTKPFDVRTFLKVLDEVQGT
jgi:signal transduction histidine kinase/ActR/RegA family two-component response regulator